MAAKMQQETDRVNGETSFPYRPSVKLASFYGMKISVLLARL